METFFRWVFVAGLSRPGRSGQLPDGVPPPPPQDADLPALAAGIERWLPVVGATSYSNVDNTADFTAAPPTR